MSVSLEKGGIPRKLFRIQTQFLNYYAFAAFTMGSLGDKEKSENCWVLCIARFLFLTYLCNKRLKLSIHCVQLWIKIAQIARASSK